MRHSAPFALASTTYRSPTIAGLEALQTVVSGHPHARQGMRPRSLRQSLDCGTSAGPGARRQVRFPGL